MAEPVFAPANIATAGYSPAMEGIERGQSMMQRASQMRQQEEMMRMQKEKFTAELPVIIAKAKADEASAQAALRARDQMENLRRNGAAASVQANEEYIGALAIPNWDEQARALAQLQAKYGWMANVRDDGGQPIYKGFLDTLDNSTANAFMRGKIDKTISGQMEIQGNKSEAQLEIAKARTESQKQIADDRMTSQKEIAELKAANKVGPAQQKFEEELGTKAAQYYSLVQEKVASNRRTLDVISDNRRLLEEEGADQGVGENAKLLFVQGLNAITRTVGAGDLVDTKNPEQLKRNYASFALDAAEKIKGQGQVTENERKMLADTVAKFGNSKKAALAIMDIMEGFAAREIAKAEWLRQKRGERGFVGPEGEAEFYEQNPLSFFMPASGEPEDGGTDERQKKLDAIMNDFRKRKQNGRPEGA